MASPVAEKALSKAKIQLMSKEDTTFFAVICCQVLHVWNNKLPTAATNGIVIKYNEEYWLSLSGAERLGLMLHEVLHIAFQHCSSMEGYRHERANRAMDYAINIIIDRAGFKLPRGALLDYMYDGMTWTEIYDLLEDEDDPDADMDIEPNKDPGVKDKIDDLLVQASQASNAAGDKAGSIPGALDRYIADLLNPKVPWYRILRSFFTRMAKIDYNFQKPNRRFFTQGIIMPSLSGVKLAKGAVSIDVSGSVQESQFIEMVTETASILKGQEPDVLYFQQFDTRVIKTDEVHSLKELAKVQFTGGGGTRIDPVMQWAVENKPNWLIVFTDGYYTDPTIIPACPVIWVIHGNPSYKAPFGKTIHYEFEGKGL